MSRIMEELLAEAVKKREIEIAISLLKDGMHQAKVAKHSGLTPEEVEALAQQGSKALESMPSSKVSSEPLLELIALKRLKASGNAPGIPREEGMCKCGVTQEKPDTAEDAKLK